MSMFEILLIFFVLSALQPVLKQRLLEASRRRVMAQIEKDRGSRIILLIHREEKMSFLGFPVMRFIDLNDWEQVIRVIHLTESQVPIDLVLHTPGGLALASLQIARAISMHPAKVTVFVPHYAMSGGTLIALAADEIVMSHHAVLGPVDPQLGSTPAASLLKAVAQKPFKDISDETLILADQAEKAIAQVHASVKELLGSKYAPEKTEELAQLLSSGTWTHDHPITYADAKQLGLQVSCDMPKEVLELMDLFPQPVRRHHNVQFLPVRRQVDTTHPK